MGVSGRAVGVGEAMASLALAADSDHEPKPERFLDLAMRYAKDGDDEALVVLAEVTRLTKARADQAWADRTEANRDASQAMTPEGRDARARERDRHEIVYRTLCELLGDQAALSRILP